jgi:hypothetical protein
MALAIGKAWARGGLTAGQGHHLCRRPRGPASGAAGPTGFADGRPSANPLCRRPSQGRWQSLNFFLFFSCPFFSGVFLPQIQPNFKSWDNFEFFSYILLIISASLNFSGDSKFELQVHEIMELFDSKHGIHDARSMLRP